jgi:hypothetical protein
MKAHLKITVYSESISFLNDVPWRRRLAGSFSRCVRLNKKAGETLQKDVRMVAAGKIVVLKKLNRPFCPVRIHL